jgi:hypothetical protein
MAIGSLIVKVVIVLAVIGVIGTAVAVMYNSDSVRRVMGYQPGGRRLGTPTAEDLPNLAERLSNLPASQHVVTRNQEVVMTGIPSHTCVGGDNEVLLNLKNDIGADQLDVSYTMEEGTALPVSIVKLASCAKESFIKQCIPIGKLRLSTLAVYYTPLENVGENQGKPAYDIREEKRVYREILFLTPATKKLEMLASDFDIAAN